jgi:hypothetical protein
MRLCNVGGSIGSVSTNGALASARGLRGKRFGHLGADLAALGILTARSANP